MIRINLLPHREAKRLKNKRAFVRMLILAAVFAGAVVLMVGLFIQEKITEQAERNAFITAENKKLDKQIEEIATLKQDIEALKARQQAVEDLQSDRNQPAYLLDELVKQVPEGIYLRSFTQEGQKVSLTGYAQSNERVSELLHNLNNNSPWLERPELIESKSGNVGVGKETKRVYEFSVSVGIKRLRDKEKASQDKTSPAVSVTSPTDKASNDKTTTPPTVPGGKPSDKSADASADKLTNKLADKPANKSDNSAPTTVDKTAIAKSGSNAVTNGPAVNAPKKP
jgi:type IV pilus assembly protein PilN